MDSDDDYASFALPVSTSPPIHHQRLRRLKKSIKPSRNPSPIISPKKPLDSIEDLLPVTSVDFAKLEALEASHTLDSDEELDGLLQSSNVDFDKLEALEASQTLDSDEDLDVLLQSSNVDFAKLEALEAGKIVDSEEFNETELDSGLSEEPSKDLRFDELNADLNEKGDGINIDLGGLDKENDMDIIGKNRKETKRALGFDDMVNEIEGNGGEKTENTKTKKKRSKRKKGDGFNKELRFFDGDNDKYMIGEKSKEAKRVLESDDAVNVDSEMENPMKKRSKEGDLDDTNVTETEKKKKKKKKISQNKEGDDDDGESKLPPAVNKRKEEKERQANLKLLHAESQRVLRESRDAAFKPIPVVHKPISSLLEKIRQRKLEVSKKTSMLNNRYVSEETTLMMDIDDDEEAYVEEIEVEKSSKEINLVQSPINISNEIEKVQTQVSDKESTPPFRAPFEDTEDIFSDFKESEKINIPSEEIFVPSSDIAMKLQFDSANPDDSSSSEEEDNDKENIIPIITNRDPVKAFVDEEAEEEEDSDNDINLLKENEEDDDISDLEELKDMIATQFEEKPIDNEKRNELHQKWLEQQDDFGTDNLMQRLKYGAKYKELKLLNDEKSDDENENEYEEESDNEMEKNSSSRMNSKRTKQVMKQMIAQMYSDKDDVFLSDEDEEMEKNVKKQRVLARSEERIKLVSPAEDESSSEVFGLIKKLNIAPDNKKKPKPSSFFDTMLRGNSDSSSKSSFVGRISNNSLPSSHKQRGSVVKSFIFGRDDSNSRSSFAISEDSSDTVLEDNKSSKSTITKVSASQVRFSNSQKGSSSLIEETDSNSSLMDLLKRSSKQSSFCNTSNKIDLSRSVLNAFKIPKGSLKIQGRSR